MQYPMTPDGIGNADGIIGVVGVAPWSTLQFCEALYQQVPALKDWHFPRVLIDVNTKIPSRGRHFDLGEENFSPYIKNSIIDLKNSGANVVVVTCNTAHIHYNLWNVEEVPVPHAGLECANTIKKAGGIQSAILCGLSLRASNFYEELFESNGLRVGALSDIEALAVAKIIAQVKKFGRPGNAEIIEIRAIFERLQRSGVDSLVLACTELSVLAQAANVFFRIVVDSNVVLARAALRIAAPRIAP